MTFRGGLGRIARDARLRRTTQRLAGTDDYGDYIIAMDYIGVSSSSLSVAPAANMDMSSASISTGMSVAADEVTVADEGIYLVSISGTVSSETASNGDALRLRLTKNGANTTWFAQRDQLIYSTAYDSEDLYSAENVSVACVVNCEAGDTLAVINDSASAISVAAFVFTSVKVAS